jgi:hypothetical protein
MPHTPADSAGHADHDPLAIAAYAAGDATGSELDAALARVAACPGCAALHHDLRAIAAALPALPAPARTRDFRLAPEQAAALRPAGWRRILAPLAGPRFSFAGPLGTGLATLGIAGLLVAGAAGMPLGGATAAPAAGGNAAATEPSRELAAGVPSEAPSDQLVVKADDAASPGAVLAPVARGYSRVSASEIPASEAPAGQAPPVTGATQAGPMETAGAASTYDTTTPDGGLPPVLPIISGLALLAGLGIGGLRLAGRRLGAGA